MPLFDWTAVRELNENNAYSRSPFERVSFEPHTK